MPGIDEDTNNTEDARKHVKHVFEGKADVRQSEDVNVAVSRFRPRYRALNADEVSLHDRIKSKAEELEKLYQEVHDGRPSRYQALAITSLEESVMWAVKDLTA